MRLSPPDPLTIICTWIAAIYMAVREGAERIPRLSGLAESMGGAWSYLPLGVLTLAATVYLARMVLPQPAPHSTRTGAATRGRPTPRAGWQAPGERDFLDRSVTATELLSLIAGRTEIQAQRLFEPYIDKWLHVDGYVLEVTNIALGTIAVLVSKDPDRPSSWVTMKFPQSHNAKLFHLSRGAPIRGFGRIASVSVAGYVTLEDCELAG